MIGKNGCEQKKIDTGLIHQYHISKKNSLMQDTQKWMKANQICVFKVFGWLPEFMLLVKHWLGVLMFISRKKKKKNEKKSLLPLPNITA